MKRQEHLQWLCCVRVLHRLLPDNGPWNQVALTALNLPSMRRRAAGSVVAGSSDRPPPPATSAAAEAAACACGAPGVLYSRSGQPQRGALPFLLRAAPPGGGASGSLQAGSREKGIDMGCFFAKKDAEAACDLCLCQQVALVEGAARWGGCEYGRPGFEGIPVVRLSVGREHGQRGQLYLPWLATSSCCLYRCSLYLHPRSEPAKASQPCNSNAAFRSPSPCSH